MGRFRKRKSKNGIWEEEVMQRAVKLVLENGTSIRKAATVCNLSFKTVSRYVKKKQIDPKIRMCPNYNTRQIFTSEQENDLVTYLKTRARLNYGLDITECRALAYKVAIKNNIVVPSNWNDNHMAGKEWLLSFRKRNPSLSLRTPEACNLSSANSFNKDNVSTFFDNLKSILKDYPELSSGVRIFNFDETPCSTVHCTSAERGTKVTVGFIINAAGTSLPPVMIFPRVNMKRKMIRGSPAGTLGLASPNAWMNADLFIRVLKHFIHYSGSSKKNRSLLIFNNHESHLSYNAIKLAEENGIIILTIPPHCSNRLQPLDVSVFSSFKRAYNNAIYDYLYSNPGIPVSIYDIAEFVMTAQEKSMTPQNIISGFQKTGIFPLNNTIFKNEDFSYSLAADQNNNDSLTPSSCDSQSQNTENTVDNWISPQEIVVYPNNIPRKNKNDKRKPMKSKIITNFSEINETKVKKEFEKLKRKLLNSGRQLKSNMKKGKRPLKQKTKMEEKNYYCIICAEPYNNIQPGECLIQCVRYDVRIGLM